MSNYDALFERWETDAAFRSAFHQDPAGTLAAAGVQLSEAERAGLQALELGHSDAELAARLSMYSKKC